MAENAGPRQPNQTKCWICGDDHYARRFTKKDNKGGNIYNVQEANKIEDVVRSIPWIYPTLDNRQADH